MEAPGRQILISRLVIPVCKASLSAVGLGEWVAVCRCSCRRRQAFVPAVIYSRLDRSCSLRQRRRYLVLRRRSLAGWRRYIDGSWRRSLSWQRGGSSSPATHDTGECGGWIRSLRAARFWRGNVSCRQRRARLVFGDGSWGGDRPRREARWSRLFFGLRRGFAESATVAQVYVVGRYEAIFALEADQNPVGI